MNAIDQAIGLIDSEIRRLEQAKQLLRGTAQPNVASANPAPMRAATTRPGGNKMSESARARIAEAQRARHAEARRKAEEGREKNAALDANPTPGAPQTAQEILDQLNRVKVEGGEGEAPPSTIKVEEAPAAVQSPPFAPKEKGGKKKVH